MRAIFIYRNAPESILGGCSTRTLMSRRPTTLRGYHGRYRQATQPLRRTPPYRFPITAGNAQLSCATSTTLAFATNEAHEWSQ